MTIYNGEDNKHLVKKFQRAVEGMGYLTAT